MLRYSIIYIIVLTISLFTKIILLTCAYLGDISVLVLANIFKVRELTSFYSTKIAIIIE